MSASGDSRAERCAFPVEPDIARLEGRRRQLGCEQVAARKRLDEFLPARPDGLRAAWRDYCEVTADLEETNAALEHLRLAG
jgi:hypothetical protein